MAVRIGAPVKGERVPLERFTFQCVACAAMRIVDKRAGSMRRFVAAARAAAPTGAPIPYLRCGACRQRLMRICREPHIVGMR